MNAVQDRQGDNLIELRDLTFRYGQRPILDNVSICFERGKVTTIMGPSGTGKTTLLRLIGGQLKPEQGVVMVDGLNVVRLSR